MGYYAFQLQSEWDGRQESVAVLYHHRNGSFATPLSSTIDKLLNRRIPPSRVFIVCPQYATTGIVEEFQQLAGLALERLRVTHQVLVLTYGCNGRLIELKTLRNHEGLAWRPNDTDLLAIAQEGVQQLVKESGTLLKAPAGYYFLKPSHNLAETFIRAGNMFKDPAALSLINHLLLRWVPPQTKQLYIDSVTILPIALHFRAERIILSDTRKGLFDDLSIINFHSYDLDPNLRFPGHGEYFVLISASSSGSLRRLLAEKHGASLEKVAHLLGISADPSMSTCSLYYEKDDSPKKPETSSLKAISIPTEDFVASHGEARAVTISMDHVSKRDKEIYSQPDFQPLIQFRLGGSYEDSSGPIGFDENDSKQTAHFSNWLYEELAIGVPNNVTHIVVAGSARSTTLAREVETQLNYKFRRPVKTVQLDSLVSGTEALSDLDNTSVLIVCDEEGSGGRLLAASRALREYRHAHRHYLVGFCFPESRPLHQRLVNNLTTSGQGRKYGWSLYHCAPIGAHRLHMSWQLEANVLTEYNVAKLPASSLREALQARAKKLLGRSTKSDHLFLPTSWGATLSLQPDSIFFTTNVVSQVTVYLAIASVLQRARDGRYESSPRLADELCFDSNPFMDTVLDPDMFSRFNDGVIQAALLRACSVDELNYSRSCALSNHMAGIMKSIFFNRRGTNGEAALEFLFALAQSKIRLEPSDYADVLAKITSDTDLKAVWNLFNETPAF